VTEEVVQIAGDAEPLLGDATLGLSLTLGLGPHGPPLV
jgi:hypothetical protein